LDWLLGIKREPRILVFELVSNPKIVKHVGTDLWNVLSVPQKMSTK